MTRLRHNSTTLRKKADKEREGLHTPPHRQKRDGVQGSDYRAELRGARSQGNYEKAEHTSRER